MQRVDERSSFSEEGKSNRGPGWMRKVPQFAAGASGGRYFDFLPHRHDFLNSSLKGMKTDL